MKALLKPLVHRLPYIRVLRKHILILHERLAEQGLFPAGHYYSPTPHKDDVLAYLKSRTGPVGEIPGIQANAAAQRELIAEFAEFYRELPFPQERTRGFRYYFNNGFFGASDAIFLHCFLRKFQPRRIIEVGSGYSSAVMLDTIERHYAQLPEVTFLEPWPERLKGLMTPDDAHHVNVVEKKVQEVPLDVFRLLQAGDLLFIDSSHVVKTGSDLQYLLFDVLPNLQSGVFVHFHDIFWPFEYPADWLTEGRYWNENYFLRAFLSWNSEWHIRLFGSWAHLMLEEEIRAALPLCLTSTGGSLYIQRRV